MSNAGIDVSIYSPHSCRSAAVSAATIGGVSLEVILKHGDLSNANTFYKHYQKEIKFYYEDSRDSEGDEFSEVLFNSV